MGYTHYVYRRNVEICKPVYRLILKDFKKLIEESGLDILLAGPLGEGPIEIGEEELGFNGKDNEFDHSHETFRFDRILDKGYPLEPQEDGTYFDCCKTARKPYDLFVTAFLVIAKHYMGTDLIVRSDGYMDNWLPAMAMTEYYLKYGEDFRLDEEDSGYRPQEIPEWLQKTQEFNILHDAYVRS